MLLHVSILIFVVVIAQSQQPATINVDRNWSIPESTKLGTIVKTVSSERKDSNETIIYSLSLEDPFNPHQENPFWIDPKSVSCDSLKFTQLIL